MEYIDAHLHLQGIQSPAALPEPLRQTAAHCITQLWVNATAPADWPAIARLAATDPRIVPFFGLHPWFTADPANKRQSWPESLERQLAATPSGVGETGLDRRRTGLTADMQELALRLQLQIARRLNRPLCLHCVAAADWLLHIFKDCPPPEAGFLLHSFAGSESELHRFTALGGYFSFSPRLLAPRQDRLCALLQAVAPDRLLLESDASGFPTTAGTSVPGHPAESAPSKEMEGPCAAKSCASALDIVPLYAYAAELLRQPPEEFAARLADNARRFLAPLSRTV